MGTFVPTLTLAKEVRFDDIVMRVTLTDGLVLRVPLMLFPTLQMATAEQRHNYELVDGGVALSWPELNEEILVAGLLKRRQSERSLLSGAPVISGPVTTPAYPVPSRPMSPPCPTCGRGPLVTCFMMHASSKTKSHWFFKVYCCACRSYYQRIGSGPLEVIPPPNNAPSHIEMVSRARRALDRQNEAIAEQRGRAKAWVYAPVMDDDRPRFSQFFAFICPFCSHTEPLGVWYTSRTCPKCKCVIQVHRRPT